MRFFKIGSLLLVALILLSACAKKKVSLLSKEDTKNIKVSFVTQENSIKLKRACEPVVMLLGVTDETAIKTAIQKNANTIQIFRTNGEKRDLRFWSCTLKKTGTKSIKLAKKKKKRPGLARVAFLQFRNSSKQSKYGWLGGSLPDAINKAMQKTFEYKRFSDARLDKEKLSADRKNNVKVIAQLGKELDIDIIIFGDFTVNGGKNEITFTSEIFYVSDSKIIATAKESSATDIRMFGATTELANKIVNQIYNYEIGR